MNICLVSILPTLTKPFALKGDASRMDDVTIMVQEGYSIAFESQKIFPHRKESSIYGRGLMAFIHALAKLRRLWMGNSFQVKIDHHKIQYFLEKKQL